MSVRVMLTAVEGALKGQQFIFTGKTQCVVGRSHACQLHVPGEDCSVSRRHCLLDIDESSVIVRDLGSLNGTYLNRELIGQRDKRRNPEEASATPQPIYSLENCDELRVGDIIFHVQIDTDTEEEQGEPEEVKRGSSEFRVLACV
jgi:pSer/pThr/pTyr-binding forkhead associated (FHA) protein